MELRDAGQLSSLQMIRTFRLLYHDLSIYKLAVQMGTSVKMIEKHYGHLLPRQAIDEIAGRRMDNMVT
jgi:hypothetical protein